MEEIVNVVILVHTFILGNFLLAKVEEKFLWVTESKLNSVHWLHCHYIVETKFKFKRSQTCQEGEEQQRLINHSKIHSQMAQ